MSRLIVVSNRVPDIGKGPPPGGLAVALKAALEKRGGIWMGWSGKSSGSKEPGPLHVEDRGGITFALSDLSRRDLSEYYAGFANSVLWPLCHYRLDLTDYARKEMAGYFRVNRFFAERLRPLIEPDDIIWVHDYHLIPLASELRRLGVENRMGFFMHIPWPSPDVFLTLPVHEAIIGGLTAYDVVGFQTKHDATNFASGLEREGIGGDAGDGWMEAYGRRFRAGTFPISIATREFAELARRAVRTAAVRRFADSLEGRDLIIGVDRLDYSKGLTQRIDGYEKFLAANPAWHGRTTMLQVTPKSRTEVPGYAAMQREVAESAGRVNGAIGRLDWVPIRYVNRAIDQKVLAGLYRVARVGMVTPLRDGMNLVAKEFVAAQDPEDPGVLVLSRFAGAAQELDGAILVNPYDIEAVGNAVAKALSMPLEERRARFTPMMQQLSEHDISRWCSDFLDVLRG
ncbi:alpha,alpha-trehalose-phosphate synthase (UDP-forming) [Aquamicrobium lusatiense]|uniref:alpha,alpha-trehalose-phosphate synthase (UDP-forming) n=2 Tax=Aquamicrobium TaxID=69278 RepID=UPI0024588DD8|nr:alpha,alpha-trehalose-phosphate synthase (UDP-forming) [Aquamicrobium lusatiense]MDH4989308.1 alpha,alpha-trehalose-phosphate synthase (UDP-forming) [Aquamicrobium lusatiense]